MFANMLLMGTMAIFLSTDLSGMSVLLRGEVLRKTLTVVTFASRGAAIPLYSL